MVLAGGGSFPMFELSFLPQTYQQDTWWKHLAEIAFHIHPEDACEMDKELVIGLCKEYEALAEDSNEQHLIEMDATKPQRKHLLQKLVTMFGDGYFKMGTLDALQLISTHGVPAFQYRSTHDDYCKTQIMVIFNCSVTMTIPCQVRL